MWYCHSWEDAEKFTQEISYHSDTGTNMTCVRPGNLPFIFQNKAYLKHFLEAHRNWLLLFASYCGIT